MIPEVTKQTQAMSRVLAHNLKRMKLVDVHTHMYDAKFFTAASSQFDEQIIAQAHEHNVSKVIVVSEDCETAQKVLALCDQYPAIFKPSLGLHPCCAHSREQISEMVNLIREHKDRLVCIGEVGLDYSPNVLKDMAQRYSTTVDEIKMLQQEALIQFCQLSQETGLALNVHSRSAGRPCVKLLQDNGARHVLMHCFDGSVKVAKQVIEHNVKHGYQYYFSIPANVCRSSQLQDLVRAVPLEYLMLETDSPALLPQLPEHETKQELEAKLKSARNEPKNVLLSCKMIAELKEMDVEAVAEQTTKNAMKLFPRLFGNDE